ncbi:MAG: DUF4837 family protein [Gemmatimonadota bacterium]
MMERPLRHRDPERDGSVHHRTHRPRAARAARAVPRDDARPRFMVRVLLWFVLPLALLAALGCEKTQAYGEANSIIVGATNELWDAAGEQILETLEPRIVTVRDERTLKLTQQDPREANWSRLNIFRQVLVIGTANDPWVAEALDEVRGRPELSPPQVLQANNVWARGQLVTIVLLPDGAGDAPQAPVAQVADSLGTLLNSQYREFVLSRMYVSGRDTTLARELRDNAGFSLMLPEVYRWDVQDSVYKFRNDNPDPSELIREIAVRWREITPGELDQEEVLERRAELVENYYRDPQAVDLSMSDFRQIRLGDNEGYQLQAIWQSPPGAWPAAGPFITRVLRCPAQNREYLLDAWLFAPGKDKYEYMIQLQTILDSFRCG